MFDRLRGIFGPTWSRKKKKILQKFFGVKLTSKIFIADLSPGVGLGHVTTSLQNYCFWKNFRQIFFLNFVFNFCAIFMACRSEFDFEIHYSPPLTQDQILMSTLKSWFG